MKVTELRLREHVDRLADEHPPIELDSVDYTMRSPDRFGERFGHVLDYMARVELEVAGRNLHTWTDYSGYDPEINMFGTSTVARGTDFAVYPSPRTVSFGIRVNY